MLQVALVFSVLLTAQDPSKSANHPPVVAKPDGPAEADALAKYNGLRDKVAETGAAHLKMAQWCEQHGLKPEAAFHYGKVIELEPKRDVAWLKLGFKKHDGRWMTAAQIVAEDAQKKADKEWSAKFKKWHKEIHGGAKRAEAQAAFDAIEDPAAIPSIYREFCGGGTTDQTIGIQLLGQIKGPIASKAIAVLAVYGKTPEVRRVATETLRSRPSEEFLDWLVSLLKDLYKYETRPVGGPGSPGILFVEGERFNARRFYAPPPPPSYTPRPGDMIGYDANGFPTVSRTSSFTTYGPKVGVAGSKSLVSETDQQTTVTETYSFANAYIEAQQAAANAQAQLAGDIAQIEAINQGFRLFNDLVMAVAQTATGKTPGTTAKDWRNLLARGKEDRYNPQPPQVAIKPTFDEMVSLNFLPDLSARMSMQAQTRFLTQITVDT